MDAEKIIQDLNRRFAEPLPEFYTRRVIFWNDDDREFEDKIDEIQLDNAAVAVLNGSNTFAIKKLLCADDTTSNYLVYNPLSFTRDDDNWLINVQLYSEEFRADLNSIWMDEMGLPATPVIRKQVKHYRKFFNAKPRREAVKKLNSNISTAAQMHLAVMAAICGCTDTQANGIIRAIFHAGLDKDNNELYQSLVNYGADNAFWVMVAQATGYNEADDAQLGKLAIHMLLTAATRTMPQENLAGLDSFISIPHQAYCYDFISEWIHSEDRQALYDVARYVEKEAKLHARFAQFPIEDLADTECFPCINECILTALMTEISQQVIKVEVIKNTVEKRRTMAWYDETACFYDGILQVANMQQFFVEHSYGFHTVEAHKIWKEYTTEYYKMDTYYRLFHVCFQDSLTLSNAILDDLFKHVADQIEGLYAHWYLGFLSQNWTDACADELTEYGKILEVPQQTDFYREKVQYAGSRVFVIISDALRYEVAATLSEQLRRETQSKVTLNNCAAVFPTATKFGMAALLPHKNLTLEEKPSGIAVLADGMSTDAGSRDKVLKAANKNSVALKYDNIIGLKRAERAALVKGMEVVYIYHDKIDEASHTSDNMVFPACDDAITEIKNLVRIIVNEFGGTNIIITADHGFLYTYQPLSEDGKVDRSTLSEQDVEVERRYLITRKGAAPEYLVPVKFFEGKTEFDAFAPRETVRIKKKGGGLNFVHGGISLQEMVVPVIEYQYLRSSTKAYQNNKAEIDTKPVALSLVSANRKVSNMLFNLNFFQTDAVGGNREAASYQLYFTDVNGKQVSDSNRIIADKTSENPQDRQFRCSFNLKSQKFSNTDTYFLVIADETGLQMPQKIEFQIDIAFAIDEFNFF